tara:strand:- start:104 stop:2248 length:2145 start_codon:yes stop_codon:yes gene_type:complete
MTGNKESEQLQDFLTELLNSLQIGAEIGSPFQEHNFIDYAAELLSGAGIYDNIEPKDFKDINRGIKIDGFNWNPLERILSGIIVNFSGEPTPGSISKTEIEKLGKRTAKFIENISSEAFKDTLAPTSYGRDLIDSMSIYLEDVNKYRVIILTDLVMSDRVKLNKLQIDNINGKEAFFEIWDLERIRNLATAGSESEPFSVDFKSLCGGLKALPANVSAQGMSSYMCVMPAITLRELYDNFGQRLLESNVRTFLQFRGKVNRGMKETLLKNPENFFAYNNGLTVTASGIKTEKVSGETIITQLDNMQIVNGGQTTSAIYFTPLEKSTQKDINFKDIDLSKVFVQMKLTVIEDPEQSEIIKSNVAEFANTQNTIQAADLVSNHPLHRKIEEHSRNHSVPPGENQIATKWFYERARGQYETRLRALTSLSKKKKFEVENPKSQRFSKTDMAKYINTWRMSPFEVKRGAQKNLELLGGVLKKEWDKNPNSFEIAFYKELIAKAILFKSADYAIQYKSSWYKLEPGFKAETTTYTVSLLRFFLQKNGHDINLKRIYDSQKISESLTNEIINLAKVVRDNILDLNFRDGAANPSEFCKSKRGWEKFKLLNYNLSIIEPNDYLNSQEIEDILNQNKTDNEISNDLSFLEKVGRIDQSQWREIYDLLLKHIPETTAGMRALRKFTFNASGITNTIHLKDYEMAIRMLDRAQEEGYILTEKEE